MLAAVAAGTAVEVDGVDMVLVEDWIAAQWPALQAAWAKLRRPPASESFDPSRADFAVARCLWEGGWSMEEAARILLALPGSRAAERGETYALLTATRAANVARRPL